MAGIKQVLIGQYSQGGEYGSSTKICLEEFGLDFQASFVQSNDMKDRTECY